MTDKTAIPGGFLPDIIVVGAGTAGLPCALAAAAAGARVLLLEKHTALGGTLWQSGGSFTAADSRLNAKAGTDDSPELFYHEAIELAKGASHPELVREIVYNAGRTLDWMLDLGVELASETPFMGLGPAHQNMSRPRTFGGKGGGGAFLRAIIPHVLRQVELGSIVLLKETRVTAILREPGGAVSGVRVRGMDGSEREFHAARLVLASGGFGANREMMAKYNPGYENAVTLCPPIADGACIELAEQVGAKLVNMSAQQAYIGSLPSPNSVWRGVPLRYVVRYGPPYVQGMLWVNAKGQRVANEDCDFGTLLKAVLSQWDKTLYVVFDKAIRALNPKCLVTNWDWDKFDAVAASGGGNQVASAATLRQLAQQIGIDADGLEANVARWNGFVEQGSDPDFGRVPKNPLATPPFYAVRTRAVLTITRGGVDVNSACQVLDKGGAVIPGLYAIGEVIGCQRYMGEGSVSGFGDVAALVLGKLVGERLAHAARDAT